MSKKNKKPNDSRQNVEIHCPVESPFIVSMDVLSYATDEDLRDRERHLQLDKEQVIKHGFDPKQWEVELAYVYREKEIRENRRNAHERFMNLNPDHAMYFEHHESSVDPELN